MSYIDYYQTLGISKTASADDIRKAFRKLARKYHPDVNPNNKDAEKKFKEINEANTVLSDPEKRKKYDTYGKDWEHAEAFQQANQRTQNNRRTYNPNSSRGTKYSFNGEEIDPDNFSDFFQSMFFDQEDLYGSMSTGNGRRTSGPTTTRGVDYKSILKLNLEDIIHEEPHVLDVNGKKIRIKIPPGVENGQTIKVKGQGGAASSGKNVGDLYIEFEILPHPRFVRQSNDLYANQNLDLYTALLGGEVDINTLVGNAKVKVKAGTQPGTKIRLKGKGLPAYRSSQVGDLIITYDLILPTNLTEEEIELIKKLKKIKEKN